METLIRYIETATAQVYRFEFADFVSNVVSQLFC
jgi:hypothetical protein